MEIQDLSNQEKKYFDTGENHKSGFEIIPNLNQSAYDRFELSNADNNNNITIYSKFTYLSKYFFAKIKEKIKKNRKNETIAFMLTISIIFFYILSLKGCGDDAVYCYINLRLSFYLKIIIFTLISCICTCVFLILLTFGKISFFHLSYLIFFFLILIFYDHGTTYAYHGYLNLLVYIVLLLIIYPVSSFIYLMIRLIRKKKYKIYTPIFIILFILLILFNAYIKKKTKCTDWDIGINNTRIYNNKTEYACQINFPKSCYIKIFDGKFNITKIMNLECNKRDDTEKIILFDYMKKTKNPYITSNTKRIGYPHLNKGDYPENEQDGMKKLSKEVLNNLVDMDNLPPHLDRDKIPETYVDFNDYPDDPQAKYGKLHFNITKNQTLVNERKKNAEKNNVMFTNIIQIFIDTVSRAHINRKFPKLKKWLEKHMKYDSKDLDLVNFQFLKFHSTGHHTVHNLKPLDYGESLLSPNGINILKYLKEKGYICAQTDNYCGTQPYQIHSEFYNSNITTDYFDHELISLFCEPNYYSIENPLKFYKGNVAIFRRCLYGYDTFHHLFNYSKLFWRTYKDSRKFLRISSMDSHEATAELISLIDGPLVEFLDDLYTKGDLNDTVIFLFSDHGNHASPHLKIMPTDELKIERIMPFFFLLIPKKINKYQNEYFLDEFYDNLYKNQQSLSTCYDIHDTIIHIIFNERDKKKAPYSKNGTSLFNRINDKARTCEDYPELYEIRESGTLPCNCIKNKQ